MTGTFNSIGEKEMQIEERLRVGYIYREGENGNGDRNSQME
jgi:hypothetical protein